MRNSARNLMLVLLVLSLFSAPAFASNSCQSLFQQPTMKSWWDKLKDEKGQVLTLKARKKPSDAPTTPAQVYELRLLMATKLSAVFNQTEMVPAGRGEMVEGLKLTPEDVTVFEAKFDRMIDLMHHMNMVEGPTFRDWLKKRNGGKPYPRLDPVELRDTYKDKTLLDYVTDKYFDFTSETLPALVNIKNSVLMKTAKKSGTMAKGFSKWFIKTTLIFGLVMPIFPAITSAGTESPIQFAQQMSRRWLGWLNEAQVEFFGYLASVEWLSGPPTLKVHDRAMQEAAEDLRRYDFGKMTEAEAKQVMSRFEDMFQKLSNRRQKSLLGSLQGGQDFYRHRILEIPLNHATTHSKLTHMYEDYKFKIRAYQQDIARRPAPQNYPTAEEAVQIEIYKSLMKEIEEQQVVNLTAYRINSFFNSEVFRDLTPQEKAKLGDLKKYDDQMKGSAERLAKQMGLERYTEAQAKGIEKALQILDPNMPHADKLAQPIE